MMFAWPGDGSWKNFVNLPGNARRAGWSIAACGEGFGKTGSRDELMREMAQRMGHGGG